MARKEKKVDGRDNPLRAETTEFNDKELKQLETAAGLGLNEKEISKLFFISRATLHRRMADFPKVQEAIERGRIRSKMNIRATAYSMAASGKNPAMTMFWLKMYDRWQPDPDREDDAHTDTLIGSALIAQELASAVANMSREDVARELQTLQLEAKHGVYSVPDDDPI